MHEPWLAPVMDSRGRVFTPSLNESGLILVWNTKGEFVRSFGGHGEGPGELIGLGVLEVDAGDSIHVRDNRPSWSVFDPELRFVRRSAGDYGPLGFNALLPSGVVVSGFGSRQIRINDTQGQPLEGYGSGRTSDGNPPPELMVAEAAAPRQFWSIGWRRPSLKLWSINQGLLREVGEPIGTQFPPEDEVEPSTPDQYVPQPGITDLNENDGLLWYTGVLPTTTEAIPSETAADLDRNKDFILEVVDPQAGRVVASSIVDSGAETFTGFVNDTLAYRWRTDDYGVPRFEFVRYGLTFLKER